MPLCRPIPRANRTDVGVFACYTPISALLYTSVYLALAHASKAHEGTPAFLAYGCVQCGIGFLAGYCTSRWLYYSSGPRLLLPPRHPTTRGLRLAEAEDEAPLIRPPPPSADGTEEAGLP